MTKQLRAAIAATLVFTTMSMQAQTSGATNSCEDNKYESCEEESAG